MSIASHHLEIFNGWLRFQMIPNSSSTNKIGHDLIFPKFLWKSFYLHISCQNTCVFSSIGNDTFYVTFYVKSDLSNVFHKVSISFLRFSFIWSTSEYWGIFINTKCPGVIIKYYLLLSIIRFTILISHLEHFFKWRPPPTFQRFNSETVTEEMILIGCYLFWRCNFQRNFFF